MLPAMDLAAAARGVCEDAVALARLQRDGRAWAVFAWQTEAPADPLEAFDRCKRTYSRFVTLLHDYPLYEFTIIVRR